MSEIVIERGQGGYVWDADGQKYIDFVMGIASVNQGHCHPRIVKALQEQAGKLHQVSRFFYNTQMAEASEYFCNLLGYDKLMPCNTGVEACETAVKYARRWGYEVKMVPDNQANVLMFNNAFWGRSISASGGSNDPMRYRKFGPYGPGFPLVDYNDLHQVEQYLKSDPNCVAVMMEPIQGNGGCIIPYQDFIKNVKRLCKQYNVLLICDEVQTGFGRTGELMGYNNYLDEGDKPDIVTMAKSMNGGIYPCSAVLADDNIMGLIGRGEHGSTFGGNPLGMAVSQEAVKVLIEENMIQNSKEMGKYMLGLMKEAFKEFKFIKEIRGKGLFMAIEMESGCGVDGADICNEFFKHRLLASHCRKDIVRVIPYLGIHKSEIDNAVDIMKKSLKTINERL